jgi:GTP cyclohydrolase I
MRRGRDTSRAGRGPDRARLRRATRLFLAGIGEPDLKPDMRRTPDRVAAAWSGEILAGYRADPRRILAATFPGPGPGLVVLRDVPFVSVCVHHLLPFQGVAHVAYLPGRRLVGLSKIARVVDAFARRLQLQERLTRQIAEALERGLAPRGVACRIDAEHLCMTARGARKRGSRVATTAYTGVFDRDPGLRAEFLRLAGIPQAARARRSVRRRGRRPARG